MKQMKNMRNRVYITLAFSVCLLLSICMSSSAVQAAGMSQNEIVQRLKSYSEWLTDDYSDTIQLVCPKMDVTDKELFLYLKDIADLLEGVPGEDACNIEIVFYHSFGTYGTDLYSYADVMFEWEDKINYYITNWSDVHSVNFVVGERVRGSEVLSYGVKVEMYQNSSADFPDAKDYYDILNEVVEASNEYCDTDMERVMFFCAFLEEFIVYDETLETNSSYLAIMEQRALCGGYANALKDLCRVAGIKTLVPTNTELNHAWSEVCIDGVWYTVDLCYVVNSLSNNYEYIYFFTDPDKFADDEEFKMFIRAELVAPTPILNTAPTITLDGGIYSLGEHVRNLSTGSMVAYSSSNPNVVTVDNWGNVTPVGSGNATVTITIHSNGKVYTYKQQFKSTYNSVFVQNPTQLQTPSQQTNQSIQVSTNTTKKVSIAKTKISKLKNLKGKKARITWKRIKGVDGYQLSYSTNKKFKKSTKTVTVKKSATKKDVKKLKKNKTYYFRIRGYKKVSGKKQYGKWSAVKKIKIKK